MRILIIDDDVFNLAAAKQVRSAEHELTVCGDADEALELLQPENWKGWEVVLADLMLPAPRYKQTEDGIRFVGEEMPIGWAFVLLAAKRGAKYAAVVTTLNHHHHPASAMLDGFSSLGDPGFVVDNTTTIRFFNEVNPISVHGTKCPECHGTGENSSHPGWDCAECFGEKEAQGKDWGFVLEWLIQ